ncbi:WD40-repeat-containing domain protein [Biscogniauxia marginata]|nr:WD40-repeat-containing domain protein [Biscogniauxia marginata]
MSCEQAVVSPLEREYVLNPITALAFFSPDATRRRQYLLAGEDTDIKIYDISSSSLCGQLPVFQAQPIHGITVPPGDASRRPPRVLAWGGHQVKVLPGELVEECIISGHASGDGLTNGVVEAKAPDWILDGRISPFDSASIVLLTAHNEVIQAQVSQDRSSLAFGRIQSPSRPILYSGNFFWVSRDCVLVAAGTVFGEILVWKCNLGSDGRDPSCEVLFVFSGHEGSIFGVNISPEIQSPSGEPLRLLASCSDDRTIRVWDITERRSEAGNVQGGYGSQISDARETGFGDSVKATEHDDSTTRCVAIAMGHISRIWQVEFAQRQHRGPAHSIIEIYSFGEDATAQKWHLDLGDQSLSTTSDDRTSGNKTQLIASLTHKTTFSNHSGKHIWSHAIIFNDDDNLLIATGGSDGKVALIDEALTKPSNENLNDPTTLIRGPNGGSQIIELSLTDVVSSCYSYRTIPKTGDASNMLIPVDRIPSAKELFFQYSFITDDRLFAISNSGRVFVGDFADELEWRELTIPDETRKAIMGYSVVENSVTNSITFIGTNGGDLFSYRDCDGASLRPLANVHGKINGIFCLSNAGTVRHRSSQGCENPENGESEILVTILGSVEAELLQIDSSASISRRTKVSLKPGFTPTSAAFCRQYLVLGSRHGLVSILDRTNDGSYSPILNIKVKLKDTITSILPLPSRDEQSPSYFLTTGRDGKFRIYEIINTADGVETSLLHETSPPFGPMVEGSWFSANPDGTQDLMLYGFRSKHFVVWNETRRQEVAAVECGGGHRNFAYTSSRDDPERVRLVFTKASQMRIFSQTRTPHKTIKTGVHGREIKAVSSSGRYVATASEDTVIRIWEYRGGTLRCLAALEKHATGIQALKWSGSGYLFSSAGNEEFFVWRVSTLDCDGYTGLAVVCEAVFQDRSEAGDLRITDFDVERVSDAGRGGSDDGGSPPWFCISMALSNSTLQSYTYSADYGFRLLGRRTYTGACLTQARHLRLVDGGRPQVLSAATDGHIAIYADMQQQQQTPATAEPGELTPEPPKTLVTRLHQNTIKALDMRAVADGQDATSYLVVTGGDDNALGITHIVWSLSSEEPRYRVESKSVVRCAHAAAITGVAIARLGDDGAVVVTASNDQRVRVWGLVGWRGRAPRVRLLDERYSSVADAGGLEVLGGGCGDGDGDGGLQVMVVGVGVEVWRLGGL